jgi:hypothetical protein
LTLLWLAYFHLLWQIWGDIFYCKVHLVLLIVLLNNLGQQWGLLLSFGDWEKPYE